jgi:hypothetical protein
MDVTIHEVTSVAVTYRRQFTAAEASSGKGFFTTEITFASGSGENARLETIKLFSKQALDIVDGQDLEVYDDE